MTNIDFHSSPPQFDEVLPFVPNLSSQLRNTMITHLSHYGHIYPIILANLNPSCGLD